MGFQTLHNFSALALHISHPVFFQEQPQRCKCRRAAYRMSSKSGYVPERRVGLPCTHPFRRCNHRSQRHSAAKRLGQGQDIRRHSVFLKCKHLACPSETRLNLVENEQGTGFIALFSQSLKETRLRNLHSAFSLYRLHDYGCGFIGDD